MMHRLKQFHQQEFIGVYKTRSQAIVQESTVKRHFNVQHFFDDTCYSMEEHWHKL